ncbi:MAG TPA: LysE family transporter [bacterium]|nr:LysE family transporter [bacterium]
MSLLALYLKAMGFGIAVAAPVGPMSLLCMRRSLVQGWRYGLATGVGIAIADGSYALVAALGLAGVSRFMLTYERPLHLAAGLFLFYLGAKAFFVRETTSAAEARRVASWPSALSSATLLTLTNPPTIIMFAAILTALAPRSGLTPGSALLTVGGVFTGSLVWWCGLVAAISTFRHMIGAPVRRGIDRIAGAVLGMFGIAEVRTAVS